MNQKERIALLSQLIQEPIDAIKARAGWDATFTTVEAHRKGHLLVEALLEGPGGEQLYVRVSFQDPASRHGAAHEALELLQRMKAEAEAAR